MRQRRTSIFTIDLSDKLRKVPHYFHEGTKYSVCGYCRLYESLCGNQKHTGMSYTAWIDHAKSINLHNEHPDEFGMKPCGLVDKTLASLFTCRWVPIRSHDEQMEDINNKIRKLHE